MLLERKSRKARGEKENWHFSEVRPASLESETMADTHGNKYKNNLNMKNKSVSVIISFLSSGAGKAPLGRVCF